MAIDAHLGELSDKHRQLDQMIEELQSHPSSSEIEIKELKRQKLRLKDEIRRLTDKVH